MVRYLLERVGAMGYRGCLLYRTELRQSHVRCDIFEDNLHGHPYPHFLPRALDHVADIVI